MKEIYVLRHANWNSKDDTLTNQGKESARKMARQLPQFDIVYTSPFERTKQTAFILTKGADTQVSTAASVPQTPQDVREQILAKRNIHPLGIAGALFKERKAHPALIAAGSSLVKLILEVIGKLGDGQKALIVSHDGTILAAERVLGNIDFTNPLEHTYGELEGFVVGENLKIKKRVQ